MPRSSMSASATSTPASWGPNILYGDDPVRAASIGSSPTTTRATAASTSDLGYADGTKSTIMDVNLCEALDLYTDGYTYEIRTI